MNQEVKDILNQRTKTCCFRVRQGHWKRNRRLAENLAYLGPHFMTGKKHYDKKAKPDF